MNLISHFLIRKLYIYMLEEQEILFLISISSNPKNLDIFVIPKKRHLLASWGMTLTTSSTSKVHNKYLLSEFFQHLCIRLLLGIVEDKEKSDFTIF